MNLFNSFLFLLIFSINDGNNYESNQSNNNIFNNTINIAIDDFIKSCSLSDEDSIFNIRYREVDEYKIVISILRISINKEYQYLENIIGSNEKGFPTRFAEVNNKLFLWYDSTHYVTQDLLNIMKKYNHLEKTHYSHKNYIAPFTIDETIKGAHYYFCKCDLTKYKRVVSRIAVGWYKPPRLKCKCNENE